MFFPDKESNRYYYHTRPQVSWPPLNSFLSDLSNPTKLCREDFDCILQLLPKVNRRYSGLRGLVDFLGYDANRLPGFQRAYDSAPRRDSNLYVDRTMGIVTWTLCATVDAGVRKEDSRLKTRLKELVAECMYHVTPDLVKGAFYNPARVLARLHEEAPAVWKRIFGRTRKDYLQCPEALAHPEQRQHTDIFVSVKDDWLPDVDNSYWRNRGLTPNDFSELLRLQQSQAAPVFGVNCLCGVNSSVHARVRKTTYELSHMVFIEDATTHKAVHFPRYFEYDNDFYNMSSVIYFSRNHFTASYLSGGKWYFCNSIGMVTSEIRDPLQCRRGVTIGLACYTKSVPIR